MKLKVNRDSPTPIAQQIETGARAWIAAHGAGGGMIYKVVNEINIAGEWGTDLGKRDVLNFLVEFVQGFQ